MNLKRFFTLLLLAAFVFAAGASYAFDEKFWEKHTTASGLFETLIRKEKKEESAVFPISDELAAVSEHLQAELDYRPYKNTYHNYEIKVEHTFGTELRRAEREALLAGEVQKQFAEYDGYEKIMRKNMPTRFGPYYGHIADFVYKHEENGPQGVKFYVIYTNMAKILQKVEVPADFIDDFYVDDFFNSFSFRDGWIRDQQDIAATWPVFTSPREIFRVQIPPKTDVYFEKEPDVEVKDEAEVARFEFWDPVRLQTVFYNLYSYEYKTRLDFKTVRNFIDEIHVRKHNKEPSRVVFEKDYIEKTPYMSASYFIPAPKKFPYLNHVTMMVYFSSDHIFVQEIISSDEMAQSRLVPTLLENTEFMKPVPNYDPN